MNNEGKYERELQELKRKLQLCESEIKTLKEEIWNVKHKDEIDYKERIKHFRHIEHPFA